jgi:hypothetical protein
MIVSMSSGFQTLCSSMSFEKTVGRRIRQLRGFGITREEAARGVVSVRTFSYIGRGKKERSGHFAKNQLRNSKSRPSGW